MLDYTLLN